VTASQIQKNSFARRCNMANSKNGSVAKSAVITLSVHKEHGKVVQYRADDGTSILTGGVYVSKSFLGKSPKTIEITVREV